ncbi:SurA N-terminal domain-containing protein [Pseudazoarcus pumilus]|uniref:Periplasmic chaperone PpiD n=1 Tax=Pseudazoarcus pumilus TaxID=2067960 RepID=A0A2I6S7P9_9RHOO|nr:SurA N-terminal domain-containing protein [Pseudazoarcus pumilus]AUN95267.1 peptidylprolyl isomerase [Pseudazoarcus pumilus]
MFELVRKNKRIAQLVLAIIIVPFAFFGMDAYFSDGPGGAEVARIGDYSITTQEFEQALRERQDRIRRESDGQVDSALFRSREFRRAVLESLINDRTIAMFAMDRGLAVTAEQLQDTIAREAAFQEGGGFSRSRYEQLLQAQGMTPTMFERSLAQDLRTQQIVQSFGQSAFAGKATVQRLVDIQLEERVFSTLRFAPADFEAGIEIADEAVQRHYEENRERYKQPPRLRAEYLVFDEEAMLADVDVDEEKVRAYYEANRNQYGQPEERRARHILVRVAADADEATRAAARERAEALLAEVRAEPERFAEIARESSEDPGSARDGGDLGFFAPGAMVEAFDEAVFGREPGEIGGVVETGFGYHVIEVTEVKPSSVRPFEEVRAQIEDELRRQEASRRFPVLAEQFANTVYEQPDSLQPAADAMGLEVQTSDWISRADGSIAGYREPQLLDALFDAQTRALDENIEAIEVERGTLISARVVEFEDARQLPLEEVREDIVAELRAAEAARLAQVRGEEVLAELRDGQSAGQEWSEPVAMPRGNPELPAQAARAVFTASVEALPAYVGAPLSGGEYGVFRIEEVIHPEIGLDDPQVQAFALQYDRLVAEQEFAAFVAALREQYGVEIRVAALEPPEN